MDAVSKFRLRHELRLEFFKGYKLTIQTIHLSKNHCSRNFESFCKPQKKSREVLERCSEPENRMAFTGERDLLRQLILNYRRGVSSFHKTGESFKSIYYGFYSDGSLRERSSLIASRLHEAGIISKIHREVYKLDWPKQTLPEIGPQVLTLDHLKAGFVICFVLFTTSFVVFGAEFVPKLSRKLFHHLLPAYIVVKFMKSQKKQKQKCRSRNRQNETRKPMKKAKKRNKKVVKAIKVEERSIQLKIEEIEEETLC
jgi:hypothetical protein